MNVKFQVVTPTWLFSNDQQGRVCSKANMSRNRAN